MFWDWRYAKWSVPREQDQEKIKTAFWWYDRRWIFIVWAFATGLAIARLLDCL